MPTEWKNEISEIHARSDNCAMIFRSKLIAIDVDGVSYETHAYLYWRESLDSGKTINLHEKFAKVYYNGDCKNTAENWGDLIEQYRFLPKNADPIKDIGHNCFSDSGEW